MLPKSFQQIVLSLVMALSVPFAESAEASCTKDGAAAAKTCQDASKKAQAANAAQLSAAKSTLGGLGSVITPAASGGGDAAATSVATLTSAQTTCTDEQKKCQATVQCDSDEKAQQVKKCNDLIQTELDTLGSGIKTAGDFQSGANKSALASGSPTGSNTPGSGSGGGGSGSGMGGMGSMMSSLMPLAAVGAMAALMMNQQNQNSGAVAPLPAQADLSALQPDGSLNCSMADSYNFPGCDTYNTQACAVQAVSTTTATSMPTTTVNCSQFIARYCSTSQTPATTYADTLANGATSTSVVEINIGGTGEGLGSPFCQQETAAAYCSNPTYAANRANCPSCLNLNSQMSASCAQNPAACIAQNQNSTLSSASSTCPDDPIFSNPTNSFTGTTLTATSTSINTVTTQSAGVKNQAGFAKATGSPAVTAQNVAPSGGSLQQIMGLAAKAVNANPNAMPTVKTNAAAVARSATSAGTALNLKAANTMPTVNTNAGGSTASARTVASAKAAGLNTVAGIRTASADPGPASDIAGEYGPSLFSTSTAAIRTRCQAGKLKNCP